MKPQRQKICTAIALVLALLITSVAMVANDTNSLPRDCVRILGEVPGKIDSLTFSSDGRTLAVGSYDGTTSLWDIATGQELRTFSGSWGWVDAVAFSPDGRLLATRNYYDGEGVNTLAVWSVETGRLLWTATRYVSGDPLFLSDSRLLSGYGMVRNAETGAEIQQFDWYDNAFVVALSLDRRLIATKPSRSLAKIEIRDLQTEQIVRTLVTAKHPVHSNEHSDLIKAVAFCNDCSCLATINYSSEVKLWDMVSGNELLSIATPGGAATVLDLHPENEVLTVGWSFSGARASEIRLYDMETGTEIPSLLLDHDCSSPFAFSPDGSQFVCCADDSLLVWNVDSLLPAAPTIWLTSSTQEIRLGSSVEVKIGFEEPNLDLRYAHFTVLEGPSQDVSFDLEQSQYHQNQVGSLVFPLLLALPGTHRVQLELIDGQGLTSNSVEFTVDVVVPKPPSITQITYPMFVTSEQSLNVAVDFVDQDADLVAIRYTVEKGDLDDFTLNLTQVPYAEQVVGLAEGEFTFEIVPTEPGTYRIQVTLVDATGLESEPVEFEFEVYTPMPPAITRVTFPSSIGIDQDQNGLVRFEDAEGDIVEARFEIIEGDAATIEIDPGLSFDPEIEGETDGAFRFSVRVNQEQTVTLSLILIDDASLESEPYEFTFDVE